MTRRFVLLDRDGTLIVERGYLADPDGVELLPGAAEALLQLANLGCGLLVVTNQSGIGRGRFTVRQMHAVNQRMVELLAAEGAKLDGIFFCPHTSDDGCRCRKPGPGLVEQAVEQWKFDPRQALVVGDKASDMKLAANVGATSCLVRTGYGRETETLGNHGANYVVDDLSAVVAIVATRIGA